MSNDDRARASDPLYLTPQNAVLATDLYQLTMMAAYLHWEMDEPATFELFVRRLPTRRNVLIAAGLEQCIHYIQNLRFDGVTIDTLRDHPVFADVSPEFFEQLRSWRFSGDIDAVPEGTPVFANEALIQVHAPLFEAQLIETMVLSIVNFQTSVASKAARVKLAAGDRTCAEFGFRRAHGPQAAMYATRASFIGGMDATSNVLAGTRCGIPVVGTAAHAFTMANPSETAAFERYHAVFPEHTTLLVDTYDTLRGTERAAAIDGELQGIRLDSGNLCELAKQTRVILDDAGRKNARIAASGDLNEDKIAKLLADGAPIDVFGVGTELVTSKDHPALGGVYKLVLRTEDGVEKPCMKLAPGKATYPGRKQFWRVRDGAGVATHDEMRLASSPGPEHAEGLLVPVFRGGTCVYRLPETAEIRAHCLEALGRLPAGCRALEPASPGYEVRVGDDVAAVVERLSAELGDDG